ncbi:MAG: DUF1080 domain-containing protein [Candidatus Brocadiia bacterium]
MRKALVLAAAVTFLATTAMAAEEAIEPKEKIELFNGKNLEGWVVHLRGNPKEQETFSVEDGKLVCSGRPPGYIRTEKAYKNYKLTVEWRFLKPGNSGVLVHMSGPDRVWPRSLECQGQYRAQGDFWVIGGFEFKEHKAGGDRVRGRNVRKLHEHNEKKPGEWNTYEIICDGDTVLPHVNGKLMNEAHECSDTSGRICIQSEGGKWEARAVTIEPLPEK